MTLQNCLKLGFSHWVCAVSERKRFEDKVKYVKMDTFSQKFGLSGKEGDSVVARGQ